MKYVVSANNNMYFKFWLMRQYPVFVIDDNPYALEEAEKFDTKEEAKIVADNFGGEVEEVAE